MNASNSEELEVVGKNIIATPTFCLHHRCGAGSVPFAAHIAAASPILLYLITGQKGGPLARFCASRDDNAGFWSCNGKEGPLFLFSAHRTAALLP